MEGIAKIKEKILDEARAEKDSILEQAQAEARAISNKYDRKAEELRQNIIDKAKKNAEEKKRRILSMAQLENRKAHLQAKQEIIDSVFQKAMDKLMKMPDKDYQKLIGNMLIKSVNTGNEEIIISKKDEKLFTQDFLSKIGETLKEQGKAANLKVSKQKRQMVGGFILKSANMEVNNTFDSLINMEREELETEIAKILFEE